MICPGAVPAPGQMHIARLNVSCVASNGRGGGQSQDRQRGDGDPRTLVNRDSMTVGQDGNKETSILVSRVFPQKSNLDS